LTAELLFASPPELAVHCHVPDLSATNPTAVDAAPAPLTATACVNRGVPEQLVWVGSNRLNVIVPVNGLNPTVSCAEPFCPAHPVTRPTRADPRLRDGAGVPTRQLRLECGSSSASRGLNRTITAAPRPLFVATIEKLLVSPAWYVVPSGVFTIASTGLGIV